MNRLLCTARISARDMAIGLALFIMALLGFLVVGGARCQRRGLLVARNSKVRISCRPERSAVDGAPVLTRRLALAAVTTVATLGCLPMPPAWAQPSLEGRRFDTTAGLVGKAAHVPSDILSFSEGLFHSSDCDQYAYGKGRYSVKAEGDTLHFEAVTESPTYGRNVWKGSVRGQLIEGQFSFHRKPTWWRPNPEPLEHWFKGTELR